MNEADVDETLMSPMTEANACPFLRPETAERLAAFPVGVYCRLPDGRVRIPSRDELVRFCTTGRHDDCFAYRRASLRRTWLGGR